MATSKLRASKPSDFIQALKEAEKVYATAEKPSEPGQRVRLKVSEIMTDTSIFQPREFSYGWRDVDKGHVAKLAKAISISGELDPISVVKLWRGQWYVVDGHHRLAAYKDQKWKEPIECVWLSGESLQAVTADALQVNNKVLLTLDNTTRQNAAWRYTLLGGLSQKQVAVACNVSKRQVGNMRAVLKAFKEPGPVRDRLRARFPGGPTDADWLTALLTFNGATEQTIDLEKKAQRLARSLSSRMTNTLTKDLKIAARALAIYSPELVDHIRNSPRDALTSLSRDVQSEAPDEETWNPIEGL
ncbi:ParB/RepB/Spo0J family partition protein [Bradyrhizobium sp. URHD0069]|uniref:ParB/RepB/Spo0J family partition protein n=1 Tax=Bradyrhizobium sp. URHD0069 TaxID=1380355 RepID=UPI000497F451|nr:ParB/RepB/Spo0J family partition protein [Bradyrhizobium sp. URHD0069]